MDSNVSTFLENDFDSEATAPFVFDDASSETNRFADRWLTFAATWQTDRDFSRIIAATRIGYRKDRLNGLAALTAFAGLADRAMVMVTNARLITALTGIFAAVLGFSNFGIGRRCKTHSHDSKDGDEGPLGHCHIEHSNSPKKIRDRPRPLGQVDKGR